MGVRGLETYMRNQVPGGCKVIHILEEIALFKQQHEVTHPIIIFDVMGFIHAFSGSASELLCGGRHNVYLEKMDRFCHGLVEHGAKLVFFCDGQLTTGRINEWRRRKNEEYVKSMRILGEIDMGVPVARLTPIHQRTCKKFAGSLLQIAECYGDVIISTDFDCDAAIAQYAERNDALAVVATDSDNLIYEGKWQYWYATTLHLEALSVVRYGRQELLAHLKLSRNEMKLFASLLGNDYMKPGQFKIDFGQHSQRFLNIRDYLLMQQVPFHMNDAFYLRLCKDLFGNQLDTYVDMMRASVKSYSIDFEMPQGGTSLERYTVKNVLMSALLGGGILQYELNFIEYGTNNNNIGKSFTVALLPAIKRLAGILLQHRANNESQPVPSFNMVIKLSQLVNYELQTIAPTYPEVNLPPLDQFIFGNKAHEEYLKWEMVIWALSLANISPEDISQLPDRLLVTAIALVFMVQQEQISANEADILLLAEYDVAKCVFHPPDIKEPKILDGRAVRVAQQYNKITTLIEDCLFVCGLESRITKFTFDGFYFHALMFTFNQIPRALLTKRKLMKLRLYDLEMGSSTLAA